MTGFEEEAKPWTYPAEPMSSRERDTRAIPLGQEGSLDDPEAYRDFVRAMVGRVHGQLSTKLDYEVQYEISKLIGLLVEMPRDAVATSRVYFEMAFDILASEQPNLLVARSIRSELAIINDKTSRGMTRYISYVCGSTPLNAAISALLSTILLSIVVLVVMISGHLALIQSVAETSALITALNDGSVTLLIIATHAAFIGGIVSILARIQDFLSGSTYSPPLVYISVLRKPFISAAFVVLVYAVLKVGLISFPGVSFTGPAAPYMAWALGFLCGFSERFAQDAVDDAGGRFGATVPLLSEPAAPQRRN